MKITAKLFLVFSFLLLVNFFALAQSNKIRIACVGNSITQGNGGANTYPAQLGKILGSHYDVRNFGVSGRTLLRKGDSPYWNEAAFKNAKDFDPHIIIIKLGTNDSKPQNWIYKNEFYKDYVDLVNEFRKNGRKPQIYVASPCPAFKINWGINPTIIKNEVIPLIDSVRKATNTYLIDFNTSFLNRSDLFPDGIHPSNAGYLMMAQIADSTLMKSPSGIIRYFYATKTVLEKGDNSKIYWETTPGTTVTLNGNNVNAVDSLTITVSKSVTYKLISSGSVADTSTITIEYVPTGKIKSFNYIPKVLERNTGDACLISWETSTESVVTLNGESVQRNGNLTVSPKTTTVYELKAVGEITETKKITVEVLDAEKINRSLNGTARASSSNSPFTIENVFDGNQDTFWKSGLEKAPWFYIDLNRSFEVYKIVLRWGNNYSKSYILQSINDAGAVSEIFAENTGDGGVDEFNNLSIVGRYFGIYCSSKNIPEAGCELKEFEVYARQNITGIEKEEAIPIKYSLVQNYPNPFNPETTISYKIQAASQVNLKVYDVLGNEVATLVNEYKQAGTYETKFNSSHFERSREMSSGVYFYTLKAGDPLLRSGHSFVQTKKMMLLK
ncbi:MAG: hypothetical protein A2499_05815 [Stygiobacter sp. RIFOXYC12_FULL_38_8]|nr:MAG: hypothetical protein A2X62_12190 [Stygiobacter sp. GWC2_38_9]OGU83048.1 MAG: hypothetical protein A2279_02735 [Stygiobacter sp. RIFOXYA12_FULL_38_9]OGV07243.1 MAG: hypothetical protein A2299_05180 [Stygiobacter sp. RIFOXYB2_FULL_37_11]OGV10444.1 MAG: hypothetical protein A2237_01720 [Stygiobacter sp. RIFOXYA2_FULL_38_8]OGV14531.1 MAG: hypothetical protein A2440_08830 [Stygiobacter sp. RIFOXYC2_FULL_38_25]OGV29241.1 MAG: hypothetical protein A2499_05815 [Stygiobacter sp. RIFOXYC12_FULL_